MGIGETCTDLASKHPTFGHNTLIYTTLQNQGDPVKTGMKGQFKYLNRDLSPPLSRQLISRTDDGYVAR